MAKKQVLSVFDHSGIMVLPWAEAGYECIIVDIKHKPGFNEHWLHENITAWGGDVHDFRPPPGFDPAFAAFFPPCTDVAVSGARWFQAKGLGRLIKALEFFKVSIELAEWANCPYIIENPVSTVSTYWRKPDHIFNPCDYALYREDFMEDAYTKKTCLWTGGGFVMPSKRSVKPTQGSKMHKLPPSENRAELRSMTPRGFANAVFHANH